MASNDAWLGDVGDGCVDGEIRWVVNEIIDWLGVAGGGGDSRRGCFCEPL